MVEVHCKSTALSKRCQFSTISLLSLTKLIILNIPIIENATVCERLSTYHINRCHLLTIKHFFNTLSIWIFEWMNNVCTKVKNDCQLMGNKSCTRGNFSPPLTKCNPGKNVINNMAMSLTKILPGFTINILGNIISGSFLQHATN